MPHTSLTFSPLAHPLYDDTSEICVFVKDPASEVKELFNNQSVPNIKKVWQVGDHYATAEAHDTDYGNSEASRQFWTVRRSKEGTLIIIHRIPCLTPAQLVNTYDLFICDDRVALYLPRLLGKPFIHSKRYSQTAIKQQQQHHPQRETIYSSLFVFCLSSLIFTTLLKIEPLPFALTCSSCQNSCADQNWKE